MLVDEMREMSRADGQLNLSVRIRVIVYKIRPEDTLR